MVTMGRSSPPPVDAADAAVDINKGASAESAPQSVSDWLDEVGLSKYREAICSYAGELHDLAMMTDEDIDELVAELGMPKLGARRFRKQVSRLEGSTVQYVSSGDSNLTEASISCLREPNIQPMAGLAETESAPAPAPAPQEAAARVAKEEVETAEEVEAAEELPPSSRLQAFIVEQEALMAAEEKVAEPKGPFTNAAEMTPVNAAWVKLTERRGSEVQIGYHNVSREAYNLTIDFGLPGTKNCELKHGGDGTGAHLLSPHVAKQLVDPDQMMVVRIGAADKLRPWEYKMAMSGESA